MIWFYGISSIIIQSIFLRELSVLFQSNELIIAIIFFSWLLGSGLGSSLFRYFSYRIKFSKLLAPTTLIFTNVVFFAFIFFIRASFSLFQYQAEPNIIILAILSFIFILPVSFFIGFLFTAFVSGHNQKRVSLIYFLESMAAVIGGILFTFSISGELDALNIAGLFILVSILFIIAGSYKHRLYKAMGLYTTSLLLLLLWIIFGPSLVDFSRDIQWRNNIKLLTSFDSRHGNITIVENNRLKSLYYNGIVIAHHPANFLYEEISHLSSLIHGKPEQILILGFSPEGIMDELHKQNPQKIVAVAMDRRLVETSALYLKGPDQKFSKKTLVETYMEDPFIWIKNNTDKYDLIIINISLPASIAENRYYSAGFYENISNLLESGGIVILGLPYEENKLSSYTLNSLKIVQNTFREAFNYVHIVPAEQFYFVGGNNNITSEENIITKRLKAQKLRLQHLNEGYCAHYLNKHRKSKYSELLASVNNSDINHLFSLQIYNNYLKRRLKTNLSDSWFILLIVISGLFLFFIKSLNRIGKIFIFNKNSLFLFSIGFAGIVGEILLLYYFQIASGYVYNLYGILVSMFMLGIGTGAGLTYIFRDFDFSANKVFLWLFPLWLISIGFMFTSRAGFLLSSIFTINITVFICIFFGGFLMGAIFNSLALVNERENKSHEIITAQLYSFDLIGSAFGAFLGGAILIPFAGSFATAIGVSAALVLIIYITRGR